ncbi:protein DpdG [Rubellimicrobium roseum]|uniref:Uncharacterized protein n=1 Tax=Rubellimicrobium roseum TaxID=687525 RepID=A0A5C4NLT1_9RHOB|nr:protein DpdG [Rubellimicrobium roseum]TNC74348.1 hypothetical protein FHG71_03985 [Rubellimicrobium roseum]
MSVVTTVEAVPSRLFSLYAALAAAGQGREPRDRLEACATPPSLSRRGDEEEGSTALFTNALQEAKGLGLIEEVDGYLKLSDAARPDGGRRSVVEDDLRRFMLSIFLEPERAKSTGQRGVALGLAWLLTKSPLHPLDFSQGPQDMLRRDLGENAGRVDLTSTSRYQNLLYWARFLGLASLTGDGRTRRVVPDPSAAIMRALPATFGEEAALDIEFFLAKLSRILPVLEGGWAREALEAMCTERADPDRMSMATSLALRRLADRGMITLEAVADARPRVLDFGLSQERVSRVWNGRVK